MKRRMPILAALCALYVLIAASDQVIVQCAAGLRLFGVSRDPAVLKTAGLTALPGILFLVLYLTVR